MNIPILNTKVYNHPLVYLDNAATTQKPRRVVDTLSDYYLTLNSNIHRGTHHLATLATERYEAVRVALRKVSIWWPPPFVSDSFILMRRSSSPVWNIIPTSFHGSWHVSG